MKYVLACLLYLGFMTPGIAQQSADTTGRSADIKGGIYDRPYIGKLRGNTAIGGYFEMNSNLPRQQGISEGFSFEARRFNLFVYSPVSERIKLSAEIEFEHGAEEIALEMALADFLINYALSFRAGILLVPLGKFNLTHDSPRYDIIDRPLVSTNIIPATLSDVGVGVFGALFPSTYDRLTYEIYAVNGLSADVVGGSGEGTRTQAGKSKEVFSEDNNNSPALTARFAWEPAFGGEFGLSGYTGYYNSYKAEGEIIDEKRRITIFAADWEYRLRRWYLRGEAAWNIIDVQESLTEDFASEQWGIYSDLGYIFATGPIFGLPDAASAVVARYDYIDLNMGKRAATGENIGDVTHRVTLSLSFRPTPESSIRLSYLRNWHLDRLNNMSNSMNVQLGLATYF